MCSFLHSLMILSFEAEGTRLREQHLYLWHVVTKVKEDMWKTWCSPRLDPRWTLCLVTLSAQHVSSGIESDRTWFCWNLKREGLSHSTCIALMHKGLRAAKLAGEAEVRLRSGWIILRTMKRCRAHRFSPFSSPSGYAWTKVAIPFRPCAGGSGSNLGTLTNSLALWVATMAATPRWLKFDRRLQRHWVTHWVHCVEILIVSIDVNCASWFSTTNQPFVSMRCLHLLRCMQFLGNCDSAESGDWLLDRTSF